ncbi:UPF0496 protein [Quillaja saponaria]|uniref:UPF0496 protein n=1 Tax=Quillaja saponaria TaxID=32244 RepID=A0AAD7KSD9_QUISA|nr:UPF0496 protein [Quillaja saponaria]
MMGGQSSKTGDSNVPPPSGMGANSQYTADLSSYEAACRHDPDLQTFDATILEHTNRVISSLATGVEVRSLSFDSLREVTDSLLEMNQEVVKVILECKKDIWNNQDLFSLVEDYFEFSIQTLDFCTALDKCLRHTRDGQLLLQIALNYFKEEYEASTEGTKYAKTLQELKRYKEAGDPFTEEFFVIFQSVYKQQLGMLEKLLLRKRKLDKKLKSLKTWRRVSNVIFVAAFVSALIFSVVAAAVAAPPVITALAGALAVPIGSVGKWCHSLWKSYENAVKGQREVISSMQVGTYVTLKDLDSLRVLVNKLEIVIESLLHNAEFALTEEEGVKLAMDEIEKKLEVFTETIENLTQHAEKFSRDVRRARTVVVRRIIRHPNN